MAISNPKAPQTSNLSSQDQSYRRSTTLRAILIGLLLLPVNAYWVVNMEIIRYSAHPTTLSLFFNCVFELLVLTLINAGIRRVKPGAALSQGELLVIYSMLGLGSALCGHDSLQVLVPMMAWPVYQADNSNNWTTLFSGTYPKFLTLTNRDAARDFFHGNSTLYTPEHLSAWAGPVLAWTVFIFVLMFVLQCVNVILRRQWTDNERLSFPLVRLPLELTSQEPGGSGGVPLTKKRLFWLGFAIAAIIDINNSLNYYFPSVPAFLTPGFGQSFYLLNNYITTPPWNAIGWTPISFYPFVIGIGMLMPMDFLFSLWFFFVFWKLESVAITAGGWNSDPQMPYANYQSFGAYLLFFVATIWLGRGYLKQVWLCAIGKSSELDDRDEPLRYRTALIGIACGLTALIGFAIYLGLAWWLAIVFFLIYLSLAVAITRMRAELGTPIHDLHYTGPDSLLSSMLGTNSLSKSDMGVFSIFFWFNRAYRCQPMPIQLEAFKMAEMTGKTEMRRWFYALLLAGVVGTLSGFWALLHLTYQFGAIAKANSPAMLAFGVEPWNRLSGWIVSPKPPQHQVAWASIVGFLFAAFLQMMRVRFGWWPFHPLAFAVSSSFEIQLVWMPIFVAWVIKGALLRYGGVRTYQNALPFFYGLILGQFVEGSILNIWGIATGTPTYQFWQ